MPFISGTNTILLAKRDMGVTVPGTQSSFNMKSRSSGCMPGISEENSSGITTWESLPWEGDKWTAPSISFLSSALLFRVSANVVPKRPSNGTRFPSCVNAVSATILSVTLGIPKYRVPMLRSVKARACEEENMPVGAAALRVVKGLGFPACLYRT
eukprot:CAMPEP_0114245368 /NCGR_PEP_ID=MMETSP0058-20121206/11854_1 /TAXON_ID=36894 /ORGANISM="Pyramimonas parkeae, CCMP726" /LENGTH=154 /DNA_ID=CAMNT_0001358407 /DNA_START=274 /DNA_END=735 /DNA_ORIENTATION=-